MAQDAPRRLGWPMIIAIMLTTAVVSGVLLGLIGDALGGRNLSAGVGAAVGVVGALLIARRRGS